MAIISQKTEETKPAKVGAKSHKKNEVAEGTDNQVAAGFEHIMIEPWVTEKSTNLGMENKYVFRVVKSADKMKIARAVKKIYGVDPVSIRIVNIPPKKRMRGRTVGYKSGFKKAVIRLKDGDKIELFKGV